MRDNDDPVAETTDAVRGIATVTNWLSEQTRG